ncbi:hypothetical protein ANN_01002 [Periplaneta americana]|uniref:Uncharacterized protein n=1 Tax=Periplaneta americana TaxID=6978 RepID=A0ABQ8TVL9_PERAM|nr:hypothetical protein ANN_01002 [Periplaneta americana]
MSRRFQAVIHAHGGHTSLAVHYNIDQSPIKNRCEGMHNVNHFFEIISPKFLNSASDEKNHNAAVVLQNECEEKFSSESPDQVAKIRFRKPAITAGEIIVLTTRYLHTGWMIVHLCSGIWTRAKAAEAARNICAVYGKNAIDESMQENGSVISTHNTAYKNQYPYTDDDAMLVVG